MRRRSQEVRGLGLIAGALVALAAAPVQAGDGAAEVVGFHDEAPAGGLLDLDPMGFTPCEDGHAGPFPCQNVDLLSFLPRRMLGAPDHHANDIWGWTDAQTGHEYALVGFENGVAFVDVTNPVEPVYLGFLATAAIPKAWRDVKVYADHAFVVEDGANHGMQVFDLHHLRDVAAPPAAFAADAQYLSFANAHNIAIDEETGFAYAVGTNTCGGGLHMIDVRDPRAPAFAGCFSDDGYTHDAQCVVYRGADTEHVGREICLAANEDTLTIVDVTDKGSPRMLSRTGYPNVGYTHQAWLTEDHLLALLDDELDEIHYGLPTRTFVFDLADLDAPQIVAVHTATTAAIDHNLYVRGDRAYQANYRAGLRVQDIAGIASGQLREVGFFDVYPDDDEPQFSGAWSVYPFFPSGTVVVSGIEQGLFVLGPR